MVHRRHLKHLERFHQRCLISILGIHWVTHTPDTEVLEKADTIKIEAHIHRHRLRWVGHIIRFDDSSCCMENYLLAPADSISRRNASCVKDSLPMCKIDVPNWEMVACDKNRWRKMVYSGSRCIQDNANALAKTK